MTASPQWTIWCDGRRETAQRCDSWIGEEETAGAARKYAAARGWKYRNGRDLCPSCAKVPANAGVSTTPTAPEESS